MQKRVEDVTVQLDKCIPCKAPEELIALLESGSEAQRAEAAAALTDTPEALFVLIHAAKNDESERVRDLALHSLIDTVLDRKVRTTRRGNVEYLRIGLKGSNPSSEKWIEIEQARNLYPHLIDA